MANVNTINVCPIPQGIFQTALRHTIIWTFLVGSEAIAHLSFGGSWVIDIMVLTVLIAWGYGQIAKNNGLVVSMTPAEIRIWVAAGLPPDIKSWRERRKLTEVA